MDNQHKQIKGYRDLSQEEIDLMNKIKSLAVQVGELVAEVEAITDRAYFNAEESNGEAEACSWAFSARKDLQLGFMQLTRAIAKPTTF